MIKKNYKTVFDQIKIEENIIKDDNIYNSNVEILSEEIDEINEIIKLSNALKEPEIIFFTTTV